jgi:hypothetical protein
VNPVRGNYAIGYVMRNSGVLMLFSVIVVEIFTSIGIGETAALAGE